MAIREAVSNAYDADSTLVDINIDLYQRVITIEDNGSGMTPDEFGFYLRIAGRARGKTNSVKFNRKRIGHLGVGFLAVFPFCKTLEVTSTTENSDTVFVARIPSERFISESTMIEDVTEIPVEGREISDISQRSRHYTIFRLIDITSQVDEYFEPTVGKYKKSELDIASWSGFERLKWELQEILPLDFPPGSSLEISLLSESVGMEVNLNGEKLFRNDIGGEVLDNNTGNLIQVGGISFKYAITTNWKSVHPFNARGLKIRLNNVGVGERTYFDLGIRGRTWSRLHWITGEIHILDGLDDAITLDRDNFTWSNRYEEFREFFRQRLYKIAYRIEDIASAEKMATSFSKVSQVGPVKQLVEKFLKKLPADFEVIIETKNVSKIDKPIHFDRTNKKVIVVQDHEYFNESINIGNNAIEVRYKEWDYSDSQFPACRRSNDGVIEMNLNYPLFNKKQYGQMFAKLNVILLLALEISANKRELIDYLNKAILEEFRNI